MSTSDLFFWKKKGETLPKNEGAEEEKEKKEKKKGAHIAHVGNSSRFNFA